MKEVGRLVDLRRDRNADFGKSIKAKGFTKWEKILLPKLFQEQLKAVLYYCLRGCFSEIGN